MQARSVTRFIVICICFVLLNVETIAQEVSKSRLVEITISAPALKGNLLGDPTEQIAYVYLPPSYDNNSSMRYPTLYLLHGFLGRSRAWNSGIYQGLNIQSTMDQMIRTGKIREMIIVAPNGWNAYGGAFYTNSSVTGNWEDYIVRDVVGYIDSTYRTLARPESRGIAGHSMGGFGAIVLGMKHPAVFSTVYALAPCCLAMEADMTEANPVWSKVVRLTSKEQLKPKPESFDDFYTIAFIAMAAALSPNPKHGPFFADFPFKERPGGCPETGATSAKSPCLEKNETAYNNWVARLPLYMIEAKKENLLNLRGLFIDYGEKEEFPHIVKGGRLFSQGLSERNIPHVFEIYAGGTHGNKIRERVESRLLQFFSEKLVFTPM